MEEHRNWVNLAYLQIVIVGQTGVATSRLTRVVLPTFRLVADNKYITNLPSIFKSSNIDISTYQGASVINGIYRMCIEEWVSYLRRYTTMQMPSTVLKVKFWFVNLYSISCCVITYKLRLSLHCLQISHCFRQSHCCLSCSHTFTS